MVTLSFLIFINCVRPNVRPNQAGLMLTKTSKLNMFETVEQKYFLINVNVDKVCKYVDSAIRSISLLIQPMHRQDQSYFVCPPIQWQLVK